MARPLGKNQRDVLDCLIYHGKWGKNCGWLWDTWSNTTRIMESLVKRGLVVKHDDGYYRPERVPGFKLLKRRKDGTLGPLFINARQVIPEGVWLEAEDHPTPGFAHRPGWHCTTKPEAPHLSEEPKGALPRVWCRVELQDVEIHHRPIAQGGKWYLAQRMKIVEVLD